MRNPDELVIHAQVRRAEGDGWVWSGCGHVVSEGESSAKITEVTCMAVGCLTWVKERETIKQKIEREVRMRHAASRAGTKDIAVLQEFLQTYGQNRLAKDVLTLAHAIRNKFELMDNTIAHLKMTGAAPADVEAFEKLHKLAEEVVGYLRNVELIKGFKL